MKNRQQPALKKKKMRQCPPLALLIKKALQCPFLQRPFPQRPFLQCEDDQNWKWIGMEDSAKLINICPPDLSRNLAFQLGNFAETLSINGCICIPALFNCLRCICKPKYLHGNYRIGHWTSSRILSNWNSPQLDKKHSCWNLRPGQRLPRESLEKMQGYVYFFSDHIFRKTVASLEYRLTLSLVDLWWTGLSKLSWVVRSKSLCKESIAITKSRGERGSPRHNPHPCLNHLLLAQFTKAEKVVTCWWYK